MPTPEPSLGPLRPWLRFSPSLSVGPGCQGSPPAGSLWHPQETPLTLPASLTPFSHPFPSCWDPFPRVLLLQFGPSFSVSQGLLFLSFSPKVSVSWSCPHPRLSPPYTVVLDDITHSCGSHDSPIHIYS